MHTDRQDYCRPLLLETREDPQRWTLTWELQPRSVDGECVASLLGGRNLPYIRTFTVMKQSTLVTLPFAASILAHSPTHSNLFITLVTVISCTLLRSFVDLSGPMCMSWGWGLSRWSLPSCSSSSCKQCPFGGLFSALFFAFYAFCWWYHYLKWPHAWHPVSISTEAMILLREKICVLHKLCWAWVIVLLVTSSMLMNQKCTLTEVPLSKNT